MSTNIQLFNYLGQEVRVSEIDGTIWFIASDVGKVLELKNIRQNVADLDDDEKGVSTVYTPGGPQQVQIISEPGFYKVIGHSRTEPAKAFDRWVRHEVLPAIRKTGSYNMNGINFNNLIELDPRKVSEDNKKLLRRIVMLYEDVMLGMQNEYILYKKLEEKYHPDQARPRGRRDVRGISVHATDETAAHLVFKVVEEEIVVQSTFIFEESA